MLNLTQQARLLQLALMFTFILSTAAAGSAQVVYDWSSNSKVPESYPKIVRKQRVTFTITNVNDILYSYRLEVTQTPMEFDDFKHITGLFKGFTTSASPKGAGGCSDLELELEDALKEARDAISADPKLPVGYAKSSPHTSIPLRDSIAAWRSHAGVINEALALEEQLRKQNCQIRKELYDDFQDFKRTVQRIDKAVNSEHVFVDDHVLSPGNNVSVAVFEMFNNETITSKTFTFPGTDILTLSAGALFSRIPDRLYESRKTPLAAENVLTIEGNSRATPSLVALLNYSLGALRLDGDNVGLALSAGPVIRLGGKSDTSAFGFFTGLSGHLAHRFYVTPGFHFGQFSDFPVGFGNGSSIPANFGELTPVKRWTARFGLAITFKTKDFSGLVSTDEPAVTSDESGGSAAKPKETPKPSDEDVSRSMTNRIRRSFLRTSRVEELSPGSDTQGVQAREPQPEPKAGSVYQSQSATPAYYAVSSESMRAVVHITSMNTSISSTDERVSINSTGAIREYAIYFKSGRFYFVIPHARLDVIQDVLRGRVFSEPVVEKRGDDLVLSFVLWPGARASVVERFNGLDLVLIPSSNY